MVELTEQSVDVFFYKDVVENKVTHTRTYVFRGTLKKFYNEKILLESSNGTQLQISFADFIYAVRTDAYQPEYSFNELSLVPVNHDVKIFTLTNTGISLPTEITGKFVSADATSCTIMSSNNVEVKIIKDNFKKLILLTPSYFSANKIGVEYENGKENSDETFLFTFRYTDDTPELAREKVQFIIKSANIEARTYLFDESNPIQAKFKYFKNVNVTIDGKAGFLSVATSVSKTKSIIIFFAIGFVAALVIAYLKETLDTTIKKKEDLEEITDSKILTVIPVEEDK
jgi:hypothetical protein